MPDSADAIARQTNAPLRALPEEFSIDILPGHGLGKAEYLFQRIDEKKEDEWRRKYGGESTSVDAPAPLSKNQLAKRAKAAAAAAAASLPRTPEVSLASLIPHFLSFAFPFIIFRERELRRVSSRLSTLTSLSFFFFFPSSFSQVLEFEAKIKVQGDKVSALKKEKVTGAPLEEAVGELKALKAGLEQLALDLKLQGLTV